MNYRNWGKLENKLRKKQSKELLGEGIFSKVLDKQAKQLLTI